MPTADHPCYTVCNGIQDPSATNVHKKRVACRYYLTGNCRRGSNCPFPHISIAGQVEAPAISQTVYQGEHMHNYQLVGPAPVYQPLDSAYPVFLWQPYSLPPSFDPRYGFPRQPETFFDYPDDKSDPSSVESSSTVASMDHQLRTAHDKTLLTEVESRTIQGATGLPAEIGISSSPGYAICSYPVPPGVEVKHVAGRGRAMSVQLQGSTALASSPILPWQGEARKKPLAYKTKLCKFYAVNGKCISGDKCTFIHDPASKGSPESPRPNLSLPINVMLPSKPLNKYDEYRARDFYPITWRVIGGGVMMGGQRQNCPAFGAGHCKYGDDCKFAHETELETDPVGFIEPKGEPVQKGSTRQPNKNARRNRLRSKSIKASSPGPQSSVPFPLTMPHTGRPDERALGDVETSGKKESDVAAPFTRDPPNSPLHRRTRSLSMVPTPPPPLDTAQSSYAAEL